MLFVVVRRTWGPDTIPGDRRTRPSPLQVEAVAQTDRQEEADRFAKAHASQYPASGYNPQRGYWWGRDSNFRYTFRIERR